MRRGGTPIARANAFWEMPSGFMNSSARTSPGCGLCSNAALAGRLAVIVDDLDIAWSSGGPHEADPPLIVDSDTVLADSISSQHLKPISRWHTKVVHIERRVEQAQFAQSHGLDIRWQSATPLAAPDASSLGVSEAQDHVLITYNVMQHDSSLCCAIRPQPSMMEHREKRRKACRTVTSATFASRASRSRWDRAFRPRTSSPNSTPTASPASGKLITSIHSWLVRTGKYTVLIDACSGNHKPRPGMPRFDMLNTQYLDRLRKAGVQPEEIDFVMCTHLHVDHVGWNTKLENGKWVPTFPNAKYVMSRTDHDYWAAVAKRPGSVPFEVNTYNDSVLPIVEAKKAEFVSGEHAMCGCFTIKPAPGHTPGQIRLDLESRGKRAI